MPPQAFSRPWALITPASRGIGRALARHVLSTTRVPVVATARSEEKIDAARKEILAGLGDKGGGGIDAEKRLKVVALDVLDESSIAAAAATCKHHFPPDRQQNRWHLHLAFCVPGVLFPEKSPAQVDADKALLTFRTNSLGPLLAMKHFSPLLPRKSTDFHDDDATFAGLPTQHAVWATLSARVGSVSDNRLGGWYSYRASKAAVNQLSRTLDNHLRAGALGGRAAAVALHPGTVRTGLSEAFWESVVEGKLFSPEFAAERLVDVVVRGGSGEVAGGVEAWRGRCWDWKGEEVLP